MNLIDISIGGKGKGALITYGAWTDRQRARFMEHFYPTNYQNLSFYNPKRGSLREVQFLEVRIFFYHKAKLRVPYRQQNIYNLYDIKTSERKRMERQKSNSEDNDNVQLHTPSGSFDSNASINTAHTLNLERHESGSFGDGNDTDTESDSGTDDGSKPVVASGEVLKCQKCKHGRRYIM